MKDLIKKIVNLEWIEFQQVKNEGERRPVKKTGKPLRFREAANLWPGVKSF